MFNKQCLCKIRKDKESLPNNCEDLIENGILYELPMLVRSSRNDCAKKFSFQDLPSWKEYLRTSTLGKKKKPLQETKTLLSFLLHQLEMEDVNCKMRAANLKLQTPSDKLEVARSTLQTASWETLPSQTEMIEEKSINAFY